METSNKQTSHLTRCLESFCHPRFALEPRDTVSLIPYHDHSPSDRDPRRQRPIVGPQALDMSVTDTSWSGHVALADPAIYRAFDQKELPFFDEVNDGGSFRTSHESTIRLAAVFAIFVIIPLASADLSCWPHERQGR